MYIVEERTLPPASMKVAPACSGSMEPEITCLDEVTIVTEYSPNEIEAEAVIMFDAPDGSGLILHRVLQVREEDGKHSYWTGGDANPVPDEWWVSEDLVIGYMTKIHKDVRPENAVKRWQGIIENAKNNSQPPFR